MLLYDWETNHSNLVFPERFILFKHFFIVLHWFLARATPYMLEIKENDFALFVRHSFLSIFKALVHVFHWQHHVSYAYFLVNPESCFKIFNCLLNLGRFFIETLFIYNIWSFSFKRKTFHDLLFVVGKIIKTLEAQV